MRVRGNVGSFAQRRWLVAPGVLAAVLVLLVGAAALGGSVSRFAYLHALPSIQEPEFGREVIPPLPKLRRQFLLASLGEKALARILQGDGRPPAGSRSDANPGSFDGPPYPSPDEGPLPPVSPGAWDLEVTMSADTKTVSSGDTIGYLVVVRNVGEEEFTGEFVMTSHIPFGTTDARPSPCGGVGADPDPEEPCVNPAAPLPGPPSEGVHTVTHGQGYTGDSALAPEGEFVYTFQVRVDPGVPPGTEIRNHAHVEVTGDDGAPESTKTVVVTVE
jgi:uncharacterized repeat protein (TIGR01451 family)